jgi:5-dehydro-2-deoxygluconokinase
MAMTVSLDRYLATDCKTGSLRLHATQLEMGKAMMFSGGNFLIIGRAGMDFYADPPGTKFEEATRFTTALGGSSANIAAGLTRLGQRAALVTCVSDDAVGRYCLGQLDAYGIDRTHVHSVGGEARNSLAVVETRLEDCQSVIYRNGAADFEMTTEHVENINYADYDALVTTGTVLASEPSRGAAFMAFEKARAAGVPLVFDIDYRPYSWTSADEAASVYARAGSLCDIIIGNDEEFGFMAGDYAKGLEKARGLVAGQSTLAIYKMGPKGAITITKQGETRSGVFPTCALKPTGAGDSFMAAFLASLADARPVSEAVVRGSAAASIVVGRVGCAPAMPTPAELDEKLAAYPDISEISDAYSTA